MDVASGITLALLVISILLIVLLLGGIFWLRKTFQTTTKRMQQELDSTAKNQLAYEQKLIEERLKNASSEITQVVDKATAALAAQNKLFTEQMNSVRSELNTVSSNTTNNVVRESQQQREAVEQFMKQQNNAVEQFMKQQSDGITTTISEVRATISELESKRNEIEQNRASEVGMLKSEINRVLSVSKQLHEALTSNNRRGQWGEKIAEDILHAVGMQENIGYLKQKTIQGENAKFRPDFTFILPQDKKLNMDVKFPMQNYVKYLNAGNSSDSESAAKDFIRDVRGHVKAVCSKEYINAQANTLDYVLLFIPNEAVYQFILEYDFKNNNQLFDESLKGGVVLCSPLNLFAVLRVIYQAQIHYQVDKSSQKLMTLLQKFERQWKDYSNQVDAVSKRFDQVQADFKALTGVRTDKLAKAFDEIGALSHAITSDDMPEVELAAENEHYSSEDSFVTA
ncbi:MAG: DNA recombination protein RmuC [Anaerolineae bacterium]|nr:DNA recombination protein RmuC [Anaerolineae bacterium]